MTVGIVAWSGISWTGRLNEYPRGESFTNSDLGREPEVQFSSTITRETRRSGRFDRMVIGAALNCLERAPTVPVDSSRLGVFLGTAFGSFTDSLDISRSLGHPELHFLSPISFVNTVSHGALMVLARHLKSPREVSVVMQEGISFEAALACAMTRIEDGEIDQALVGGADIYCGPEADQRDRLFGISSGVDDIPLGEGAAWILIGKDKTRFKALLSPVSIGRKGPCDVQGMTQSCYLNNLGYFPTMSALEMCAWLENRNSGGNLNSEQTDCYRRESRTMSGEWASWQVTNV